MRTRMNKGYKSYTEENGFEINGILMFGTIDATYEWYYFPGTMYRKNGDPGDPPEYDEDIVDWELYDICTEPPDAVQTVEMVDAFERYMLDKLESIQMKD